jgi:integrase
MAMPRPRKKNNHLPPRMHQKGKSYYYVVRGKWTPLGDDLNQARIKWASMENEGTSNQAGFSVALDTYMSKVMAEGSPNTVRAYMGKLKLLNDVFGNMLLDEIKPMHIARFIDSHPHKNSAKMCKAIISGAYSLAIRQGHADKNPCQGIEVTGIKDRTRYIQDAEFYAIRDKADELVQIAMDLAYLTGMRISDVLKVKLSDISDRGLVVEQKKTGKRQTFKITPQVQKVIDRAKSLDRVLGSFYLIPNHKGQAFERRVFYFRWQKACKLAGVENVHFHDIRGKHATDMKANGQDYQKSLGHSSMKQSEAYVKRLEFELVEPLNVVLEDSKTNTA